MDDRAGQQPGDHGQLWVRTMIDRIVTDLAEAESWEKLAQRASCGRCNGRDAVLR